MENQKNQIIDVVKYSKSIGMAMINTATDGIQGRTTELEAGQLVNFALCDYMGLSADIRIRKAAADACLKYGVYTPISRTYIKLGIYKEAEDIISKVFGQPCLITQRATFGHICILPAITEREDIILLDQHVHASVNLGAQVAAFQGCKMEIIRHNQIDLLEEKIKELAPKYRKIFYLTDGVYSMYGDTIPVKEVMTLLDKYPNFYLYVDDSHGMSWAGKNGRGYFLSKTKFHPRLIMCITLGKGFGCGGGAIVCPDEESRERIEVLGVPLMFTSPIAPPVLGAILESAKIHLSNEIYDIQSQLRDRVIHTKKRCYELGLPVVGNLTTPITFIPSGKPDMTSDICRNMQDHGYFLTGGVYPAVPYNNAGVRLLLNTNLTMKDIDQMLGFLKFEFDKSLKARGITMKDITRFYKHIYFYDGKELID